MYRKTHTMHGKGQAGILTKYGLQGPVTNQSTLDGD